ncbi:MAG: AbrB/MazE/SpoVT family DNA-binding domain-containing protein [Thiolinea sp.]
METTSVTSKGQVTIPLKIRQQLGIRKGSKISFVLVGDHIELRVKEKHRNPSQQVVWPAKKPTWYGGSS